MYPLQVDFQFGHPIRYKRAVKHLLAHEKGHEQLIQMDVWVIRLYLIVIHLLISFGFLK